MVATLLELEPAQQLTPQTSLNLFPVKRLMSTDTDAQSHAGKTPQEALATAAAAKHKKYDDEVTKRRGKFVAFSVSVDGMLDVEAEDAVKAISRRLSVRWHRRYSECAS
eukprot:GHVN01100097.1.p1 GENE.GHVN01100097.1~~GHVN01100097.1.p1  ORF type:complete len:109 (-),score=8.99 GHVN01100097.1:234-560(-)